MSSSSSSFLHGLLEALGYCLAASCNRWGTRGWTRVRRMGRWRSLRARLNGSMFAYLPLRTWESLSWRRAAAANMSASGLSARATCRRRSRAIAPVGSVPRHCPVVCRLHNGERGGLLTAGSEQVVAVRRGAGGCEFQVEGNFRSNSSPLEFSAHSSGGSSGGKGAA